MRRDIFVSIVVPLDNDEVQSVGQREFANFLFELLEVLRRGQWREEGNQTKA